MKSLRNLSLSLIFAMAFVLSISVKADAAVTNVRQTGADYDAFGLAWNSDPAAEGGYAIELGTDGKTFPSVYGPTTNCVGTITNNISAGTTYYIRVVSLDKNLDPVAGGYSNVIQVVTSPSQKPTMVQSGATTNSITLKWNAVAGATGYRIYRYVGTNDYPLVAEVAGTTATITSGLSANQTFSCVVCPIRKSSAGFAAEGIDSSIVTARTTPAKITGLEYTNVWWSNKKMTLAWGTQKNIDGYRIEVFNNKGKKIAALDRSYNSYDFSNMSYNTFYSYRVCSYINVNGSRVYGAWSDKEYIGLQPKLSLKKQSGGKKIKISWKKVAGATGYVVYASTKQSSGYKKVATLKKSKKTYTVSKIGKKKLKKNKTYYFYVAAKKKVGKKTYTTPASDCWYLSK